MLARLGNVPYLNAKTIDDVVKVVKTPPKRTGPSRAKDDTTSPAARTSSQRPFAALSRPRSRRRVPAKDVTRCGPMKTYAQFAPLVGSVNHFVEI